MFQLRREPWGYRVGLNGNFSIDKATALKSSLEQAQALNPDQSFSLLFEAYGLTPASPEALAILQALWINLENMKLARVSWLLDNSVVSMQVKCLAVKASTIKRERYIFVVSPKMDLGDSGAKRVSAVHQLRDAIAAAIDWVALGVEPNLGGPNAA